MTPKVVGAIAILVLVPSLRARGESRCRVASAVTRVWNIGVHRRHLERVGALGVLSHNVSPVEHSSTYSGDLGAVVALQLRAYKQPSRLRLDSIERLVNSLPDEHLALLRRFFEQGGRLQQVLPNKNGQVAMRRRNVIQLSAVDDVDSIVVCAELVHELVEWDREASWMRISPYEADRRKSPGAFREEVLSIARPVEIDALYNEMIATIVATRAYYGEEEGMRLFTAPVIDVGSKTLMIRHGNVVRALALGLLLPAQARNEIEKVAFQGDDVNIQLGINEVRRRADKIYQQAVVIENLLVDLLGEGELKRTLALPLEARLLTAEKYESELRTLFETASHAKEGMDPERWQTALELTEWLVGEVIRYVFRST